MSSLNVNICIFVVPHFTEIRNQKTLSESKIVQHQSAKNVYSLSSLYVIHFGRYGTFTFYYIINAKNAWKKIIGKRFRVSDLDEAGRWYSTAIARLTKFWKFSHFRVLVLCLDLVIAEAKVTLCWSATVGQWLVEIFIKQQKILWKIWDASGTKAQAWSGHLFNCCIGVYMYI